MDFDLFSHHNEREAAQTHLDKLLENDVVVYDRGYYSYEILHEHKTRGVHPIFRIQKKANNIFDDFINSDRIDSTVKITLSKRGQRELSRKKPQAEFKPYTVRLVKYKVGQTVFILGTTLLDQKKYSIEDLSNLYHGRWGIEELYKISKELIAIEDFHGKSERGVKQELFAHFILITLTRFFSNYSEDNINTCQADSEKQTIQTNFKNNLITVARNVEGLFLQQKEILSKTLAHIVGCINRCQQRLRPNRSYERRSKKPIGKWMPHSGKDIKVGASG